MMTIPCIWQNYTLRRDRRHVSLVKCWLLVRVYYLLYYFVDDCTTTYYYLCMCSIIYWCAKRLIQWHCYLDGIHKWWKRPDVLLLLLFWLLIIERWWCWRLWHLLIVADCDIVCWCWCWFNWCTALTIIYLLLLCMYCYCGDPVQCVSMPCCVAFDPNALTLLGGDGGCWPQAIAWWQHVALSSHACVQIIEEEEMRVGAIDRMTLQRSVRKWMEDGNEGYDMKHTVLIHLCITLTIIGSEQLLLMTHWHLFNYQNCHIVCIICLRMAKRKITTILKWNVFCLMVWFVVDRRWWWSRWLIMTRVAALVRDRWIATDLRLHWLLMMIVSSLLFILIIISSPILPDTMIAV